MSKITVNFCYYTYNLWKSLTLIMARILALTIHQFWGTRQIIVNCYKHLQCFRSLSAQNEDFKKFSFKATGMYKNTLTKQKFISN